MAHIKQKPKKFLSDPFQLHDSVALGPSFDTSYSEPSRPSFPHPWIFLLVGRARRHPGHWKNEHGPIWRGLYSRIHASQGAQSSELTVLPLWHVHQTSVDVPASIKTVALEGARGMWLAPSLLFSHSNWKVVFIRAFKSKINYCSPFADYTMLKF